MERITYDQYGRRKWNLEAYKSNPTKQVVEIEKITNKSSSHLIHKHKLLDNSVNAINKLTVVGSNKRFGFQCHICHTVYQDNMALIDHFNSPLHLSKITQLGEDDDTSELLDGGMRRATVDEVEATLQALLNKVVKETDIHERIRLRKDMEERNREKRRKKRSKK